MIAVQSWQRELADAYTDPLQLLSFLELDPDDVRVPRGNNAFPFRVTRSFASRMRKCDPADPLLLQVLPVHAESRDVPGFVADPVGDQASAFAPATLRKYHGRALLIATGGCAINCRYCFRRNFPYGEQQLTRSTERDALDWIAAESSIEEVILSGGDPLLLSDRRLGGLLTGLAAIRHLRRIRIHSRVPVVLPSRITDGFIAALTGTRLIPVMVIHANHSNEWDEHVDLALSRLRAAGVTLLNQAVLLRGVNDNAEALADLAQRFFASGVLPYYLHLLDRASGTAHFEVPEQEARALHAELRRRLPGYLVPRLVREEAGQPHKTLL